MVTHPLPDWSWKEPEPLPDGLDLVVDSLLGRWERRPACSRPLEEITRTAIDLAPHGIRVNCICPGSIDTPLLHGAVRNFVAATGATTEQVMQVVQQAQPMQRTGEPQEIARAVAFMLSDEASFMTGALMSVDGGYVCQ